jgi:adenine/guanine/hypoxanthine permease
VIPSVAEWVSGIIENTLASAKATVEGVGTATLATNGVIYDGLKLLGMGGVLVGILLGSIACFVIDRRMVAATVTALVAAVLATFGFINAPAIALPTGISPMVWGYLLLALILGGFALADRGKVSDAVDDGVLFVSGDLMAGGAAHGLLTGSEFLESASTSPSEGGRATSGELYAVTSDIVLKVVEGRSPREEVTLADGRRVLAALS